MSRDAPASNAILRRSRPRLSGAERQRRYRERQEVLVGQVRTLIDALAGAAARGRSDRLTNHLPEEPGAALAELSRRLDDAKLIITRKDAR